jgi:hemolysin III
MAAELEQPPLLRGVFHLGAFVAAVAAGIVLGVLADGGLETASSWLYGATLVAMFGVSALYHRFPTA